MAAARHLFDVWQRSESMKKRYNTKKKQTQNSLNQKITQIRPICDQSISDGAQELWHLGQIVRFYSQNGFHHRKYASSVFYQIIIYRNSYVHSCRKNSGKDPKKWRNSYLHVFDVARELFVSKNVNGNQFSHLEVV